MAIAEGFGISVRYVDEFKSSIEKNERKQKKKRKGLAGNAIRETGNECIEQELKVPFLKLEDQSNLYKPQIKEMDSWPKVNFDSKESNCPFDPPSSRAQENTSPNVASGSSGKSDAAKAKVRFSSKIRRGSCELGGYRGRKQHLKGKKHQSSSSNSNKYRELDELVNQGKSSVEYKSSLKNKTKESKTNLEE